MLAWLTGYLSIESVLGVELALEEEETDGSLLEVSDGADGSTSIRWLTDWTRAVGSPSIAFCRFDGVMLGFLVRVFWIRAVVTVGKVGVEVGHGHSDDFGTV